MNYLVRHGKHNQGKLTSEGVREAEAARDELIRLGLGTSAILLSSNKTRALQTAEVIGAGLDTPVHSSLRINVAGNTAEVVENLDDFLTETLRQLHITRANEQPLVVVTHAPLIAIAKGLTLDDTDKISNGEVVGYTSGEWNNSFYRDYLADLYSVDLSKDGTQ